MKRLRGHRRRDGRGAFSSKPRPVVNATPSFQSPFSTCPRMFSSPPTDKKHGYCFSFFPLNVSTPRRRGFVFLAFAALAFVSDVSSLGDVFSNSFLVRFRRNVEQHEAHKIADKHGFVNLGPVSSILSFVYVGKHHVYQTAVFVIRVSRDLLENSLSLGYSKLADYYR